MREPTPLLRPVLVCVSVMVATAVALRWQGRLWWCACGRWSPWSSDAWGSHTSQHLFDPYSFTHVSHGLVLYGVLAVILRRVPLGWRLTFAVCLECAWELVENSAFVIARYRSATASVGYEGDTVANSLGDILTCAVGFWLASRLGLRWSLALFTVVELVLLWWIRDNLTLNVVMLIYPLDAVRAWQNGG
jgi:hypothetical protein